MSLCERLFLQHPQEVGETYFTHAWQATKIGINLIWFGTMEIAHAIIPAFDYFKLRGTNSQTKLREVADYIDGRYQ